MGQFWAVLVDSVRESLDRKIFWVVGAITLIVAAALACIGFEPNRIVLLFGLWTIPDVGFDATTPAGKAMILFWMVNGLLDTVLGWIGVLLMIIATASFFPTMMERGAVDVLLSKPISRPVLFLYKYLASMTFVLIQAAWFVGLTFLVMWLRWGVWAPGYLLSILLMTLLFSYLYAISVYVGVTTRSTIAAILLTIAAWVLCAIPGAARDIVETVPDLRSSTALRRTVNVLAWIPPKTGDVAIIAGMFAGAAHSVEALPAQQDLAMREQLEAARKLEEKIQRTWPASIGSSLLFEGVFVGLAMWRFTRRDF
jgi:ABC-type transport system involved in multi-copper enzyme maturation permease subunit